MNHEKMLEEAKKNYKQRTGKKRVSVQPVKVKGLNRNSEVFYKVNGKKSILYSFQGEPDFIPF